MSAGGRWRIFRTETSCLCSVKLAEVGIGWKAFAHQLSPNSHSNPLAWSIYGLPLRRGLCCCCPGEAMGLGAFICRPRPQPEPTCISSGQNFILFHSKLNTHINQVSIPAQRWRTAGLAYFYRRLTNYICRWSFKANQKDILTGV
jgi:hypothetical protein